jgi:hypothetical protein
MTQTLPKLPVVLAFNPLNDYVRCPKQFYHKYLAKDAAEKKSYAQTSGIDAHDALKRRIKLREPLPQEYEAYEDAVIPLTKGDKKVDVELALGCDSNGRPCSFFDDACRLRTRIDVASRHPDVPGVVLVDWKTGKPWEDPLELKIQALLWKIHYPETEGTVAFYYWLRQNRVGKMYNLTGLEPKTWNMVCNWAHSIEYRINSNDWPPDENPLCPWCPCSKAQCSFKRDLPR